MAMTQPWHQPVGDTPLLQRSSPGAALPEHALAESLAQGPMRTHSGPERSSRGDVRVVLRMDPGWNQCDKVSAPDRILILMKSGGP